MSSTTPARAPRELEEYLLLLLADSNLPTGNFVASSGLESFVTHGYAPHSSSSPQSTESVMRFLKHSVHAYAHLNLPFLDRSWSLVASTASEHLSSAPKSARSARVVQELVKLDAEYSSMTLNEVAMRASTTQGVALLALYEKAFAPPTKPDTTEDDAMVTLVRTIRTCIRTHRCDGHLALCFGILTAAIGVSLPATRRLFLFTHARSLLSSAVRLNIVGPYLSQRLLLYDVRPIVDQTLLLFNLNETGTAATTTGLTGKKRKMGEEGGHMEEEQRKPVNTWPLAEILIARHDQLHSRIFNS